MKAVAIIPARGGSKRIPHKNVKSFFGKPMIQYSIEAALRSGLFDEVIVSTDDAEIKKIAEDLGARVPFERPTTLADDFTPLAGVVAHSLQYLRDNEGKDYEAACCILATAPFIHVDDLKKGYRLLSDMKAPAVVPVTSFAFPIFRALKISTEGAIEMVWPEHELTRSNDLPETFHDAGQFYWLETKTFLRDRRLYAKGARPLVIPRYRVQDIDTLEDWERAEKIYRGLHSAQEV